MIYKTNNIYLKASRILRLVVILLMAIAMAVVAVFIVIVLPINKAPQEKTITISWEYDNAETIDSFVIYVNDKKYGYATPNARTAQINVNPLKHASIKVCSKLRDYEYCSEETIEYGPVKTE